MRTYTMPQSRCSYSVCTLHEFWPQTCLSENSAVVICCQRPNEYRFFFTVFQHIILVKSLLTKLLYYGSARVPPYAVSLFLIISNKNTYSLLLCSFLWTTNVFRNEAALISLQNKTTTQTTFHHSKMRIYKIIFCFSTDNFY